MSFYVYILFYYISKSIIHQKDNNAEQKQNQTNYQRDLRTPGFFFEQT